MIGIAIDCCWVATSQRQKRSSSISPAWSRQSVSVSRARSRRLRSRSGMPLKVANAALFQRVSSVYLHAHASAAVKSLAAYPASSRPPSTTTGPRHTPFVPKIPPTPLTPESVLPRCRPPARHVGRLGAFECLDAPFPSPVDTLPSKREPVAAIEVAGEKDGVHGCKLAGLGVRVWVRVWADGVRALVANGGPAWRSWELACEIGGCVELASDGGNNARCGDG
jgi:hypothetical protein